MCQSILKHRERAYSKQHKRCFYCSATIWLRNPAAFARRNSISIRESARFRCTAEHLRARAEGGANTRENIVAACFFCNSRRHRRSRAPTPVEFRSHVQRRIRTRRWHPQKFHHLLRSTVIR